MFSLYGPKTGRRRRQWTPTTVTASIVAHAAVIAAIAGFAQQADARTVTEEVIAEWKLEDKPKPPPPPPPPPPPEPLPPAPKDPPKVELAPRPEPPRPRARPAPPVKGNFVTPRPPQTPPIGIPAPDPNARPLTAQDVSGVGKEGDVVGQTDASDTRAPTGNTEPAPPAPPAPPAEPAHEGPMSIDEVSVRPSLRNESEVQRALERAYPPSLRDAGVTGETVLQFVIDENGRVEPGSIEVVSSSDEGFASAARRVAASMRFSPAKAGGHSVRVTTTMPVRWTISR